MQSTINRCQLVRESAQQIMQSSSNVHIDNSKLKLLCQQINHDSSSYKQYSQYQCHYSAATNSQHQVWQDESFLSYIFILDSMNFCFWPSPIEFEYEDLANNLRLLLESEPNKCFDIERMKNWDQQFLKQKVFSNIEGFPLLEKRTQIIQEVVNSISQHFDSKFGNVLKNCSRSAVKMVSMLVEFFENFRDHDQEHKLYFYKRAQIMVADIHGHYKDQDINVFDDIEQLTTFPDYRVPQILNQLSVLQYSNELNRIITNRIEIQAGSQYELEIRAATVLAVENMKHQLGLMAIEVDWILWQMGEQQRKQIVHHHRVQSIYY